MVQQVASHVWGETNLCKDLVCHNFLLTVHRGNAQFAQLVVNICLNILMA